MFENKYSKVLTIILVIVIIAVVILLALWGYDVFQKFSTKKAAQEIVNEFENTVGQSENAVDINNQELVAPVANEEFSEQTSASTGTKKVTYKGYNVVGTIEIPRISLKYPILEKVSPGAIEVAVAVMYGPGPNQVGNTVIAGHNYRNGSFFGKNKQLSLGDKIYITDTSNTKIEYKIYNIYETSPDDGDYMVRDTNGKREISLSTCTDNSKSRLIIWAVED